MQIVIESLAWRAFGDMLRRTEEPLPQAAPLRDTTKRVTWVRGAHLREFYEGLSEAELLGPQEFL